MDEHDKQFESYLRQFRLKNPAPLPELASLKRRSSVKWVLAAAAVVVAAGVSMVLVREAGSNAGPKATVEAAGNPSLYRVGETIEAGKVVQSNSAVGLLLALEDGSRVEMREQSELKLESAGEGIRVHLNSGSILVNAAKQGAGHLYVQTRDAMVSVVGTVFLVRAEQSGTTVAVVEGEVHVQQGAELKKLLPGEQMATNPSIKLKTVAEVISWSRSSSEYVALLQQSSAETGPRSTAPAVEGQTEVAPRIIASEPNTNLTTPLSNNRLPFKVQANYVRVTSNQIRTLITIELMNRDLAFQDVYGAKRGDGHIEGTIYRIDNSRLPGFSQDVMVELPSNTFAASLDQPTLFQESRYLTPGKYKLHITVEDKNAQRIGVQDYVLDVPRIPDQSLQASSMILAYSVTDRPAGMLAIDMFALGEKRVKPNASGVFRPTDNLNVWQEIYGLTVDPVSRKPSATFEMLISQNKQEIRKSTSSSTDLTGSGQQLTYTNSVPLGNFGQGTYDIQIKVTDNLAKASLVTVGMFSVVSPSAQSDPPPNNAGRQIFERTCTACHNAQAAMGLGSLALQFSASDRELLADKRAELEELTKRGLTSNHPDVMKVRTEIEALNLRASDAVRSYGSFVSQHLNKFGGTITPTEVSTLAQYLFEEAGKKTEAAIPSDLPLQRQRIVK